MKASTIVIIALLAAVALAALYYLQRGTATPADPATTNTDDDECASNPLVLQGIITLQDCRAQQVRANEAAIAAANAENDRLDGEAKRMKSDKLLGLATAGVSKLFPNWHI